MEVDKSWSFLFNWVILRWTSRSFSGVYDLKPWSKIWGFNRIHFLHSFWSFLGRYTTWKGSMAGNSYVLVFSCPPTFCQLLGVSSHRSFHQFVSPWDDQIDCFTYRRSTSAGPCVAKSLLGDFRQRRYDVVYRRFGATWLEDFLHKVGKCQQLWGVHNST